MTSPEKPFEKFVNSLPTLAREHNLALRIVTEPIEEGNKATIIAIEEGIMYKEVHSILDEEFISIVEDILVDKYSDPKRYTLRLFPEVRDSFAEIAKEQNMSLTELLRRAAFAASHDPSILHRPDVEQEEERYRAAMGPSRWTRDNE